MSNAWAKMWAGLMQKSSAKKRKGLCDVIFPMKCEFTCSYLSLLARYHVKMKANKKGIAWLSGIRIKKRRCNGIRVTSDCNCIVSHVHMEDQTMCWWGDDPVLDLHLELESERPSTGAPGRTVGQPKITGNGT